MRVKGTRGTQRVRIRVDIELTRHFTGYYVGRRTQRSGSALLTIRSVADEVHRNLLRNVERRVHVCRVALHLALKCPARVEHCTQRSIVLSLVRTGRNTDRVVVHDGSLEQLVEPVGVAVLRITQVSSLCLWRVRKTKLTARSVILTQQLIHLTIYTARRSVRRTGIEQVTLLLQLLVDRHLVLRVHDVECRITRNQSQGIFTRIADTGCTCLTFLRRHNNHTCHGACTIDRSS